ncbi:hypothetical protein CGZ95_12685 [Enemella evansiae]|nr:hypothetical protein CGZ95_12685 [Enemella evansiae]
MEVLMRRQRRLMFGVAAAVAMGLAVSGCGTKVRGDSGGADQTLTVWSSWAEGTSQQKVYAQAFTDFTARTGIKVDVRFLGSDVWSTLKTAVPAGQGPDVLPADASRIGDYDFLEDVTPVLDAKTPEGATVREGLNANLLTISSGADGVPRMVPDSMLSYGIWYNRATNPDLASNPPQTWQNFLDTAQRSKASGPPAISLDGTQARQSSRWFSWPLLRLAGPGAFRDLGADRTGAAWDRPETLQAAKMTRQLVDQGLFQPGFEGSKSPAAQNAWADNKMTFLLQGSWVPDETGTLQAPGFQASYFPFPDVENGQGNSMVQLGALGWSISKRAKNPEGAQQLLTYLQGAETQGRLASQANSIPAQSKVPAPEGLAGFRSEAEQAQQVTITDDNAPAVGQWWDKVMTPSITDLLNKKVTPEEFVARGKEQTVQYWKNQ